MQPVALLGFECSHDDNMTLMKVHVESVTKRQLQAFFIGVSPSVVSSGALKRNLTAEQVKEDLGTLGTHLSLQRPSERRGSSVSAG